METFRHYGLRLLPLAPALLLMPLAVFAIDPIPVSKEVVDNPERALYNIVCNLANWFFAIVLVIAVITFLVGAFKFFTAGGNEAQVGQARQLILWALVGVAVALLSKSFVFVVAGLVGIRTGRYDLFRFGCD